MSNLRPDFEGQLDDLEVEWRTDYDASIAARAEYQELAARGSVTSELLDRARKRLERAEAGKTGIMAKIERLEVRALGSRS